MPTIKGKSTQQFPLPGVDSPDETGKVARVSATKGGRAVEPASLCSQRQFVLVVIAMEQSDRGNPTEKVR